MLYMCITDVDRGLRHVSFTSGSGPAKSTNTEEAHDKFSSYAMSETVPAKKTLGIIYVPDPTRCMNAELAKNDLSFVTTIMFEDEYESIKDLHNCVHKKGNIWKTNTNGKREIKVIMQEWVSSSKRKLMSNSFNTV